MKTYEITMRHALDLARTGSQRGEVPVGCVIVREGTIVGEGFNRREELQDPTAHAEIIAIREAAQRLGSWRLEGCTLYVTLEPCAMCAGAIVLARIERVVFGTRDPKAGYAGSLGNLLQDGRLNHRAEIVEGILGQECRALLQAFFKDLRTSP